MNIVIYARYSSSGQREESIEGQLKACYEYANNDNYNVIAEYIDRATTATNDQRHQFQQMMEDSEKKMFQGVLVYQLDRFARNRYDSAINKSRLKKNGIRVLSAKENIFPRIYRKKQGEAIIPMLKNASITAGLYH